MFRVSTLDLANLPRTPDGKVDFAQDFFGKEAFLTVSGQLNVETYCLALSQGLHVRPDVPRRELQHQPPPRRVLDDRAGDRLRRSRRRRDARRGLLKYIFKAVLDERADDMAFFEERIEKGVIAKLQGDRRQAFERMDYTDAISDPRRRRSRSSSSR